MTAGKARALVSWSSGKDSAFALWEARRGGRFEVVGLLTTVTEAYGRVSMHGVREEILDRQAEAMGLACRKLRIPASCSNADYEQTMLQAVQAALCDGVTHIVFGDLFLEDIRAYRERMLAGTGLTAVFPLWHRDTAALARQMVAAGLKATVVCVDPRKLSASFAGRAFDAAFLADLPESVDPCGENGEFHTCVTAGPMFNRTIRARPGDVVLREGFVFADLVPEEIAAVALR